MVKKIAILGSTGSIGRQALRVVARFPEKFKITGLSARENIELLEKQIREFNPAVVSVGNEDKARILQERIKDLKTRVLGGNEGAIVVATWPEVELVLVAVVGFSGFLPTYYAVREGKTIALANKEALVVGGELIIPEARRRNVSIIPIDSEHSAIFQCLRAGKESEVKKIILTASGGPFWGWRKEELDKVTPELALKHPNWKMGPKITVDSATFMNKGFEVLEARWLFNLGLSRIEVTVHPQSVVHSMVEFIDGSIMAQMGLPNMMQPIQYALSYPDRWENPEVHPLNFREKLKLNFEPPDFILFPCLGYAYRAGEIGGTMPAVLNAANEIAVEKFLKGKINFLYIPVLIENIMNRHKVVLNPGVEDIIMADRWAREEAGKIQ